MLTSLSIKNYALIEDITMHLQSGFTIITGETGAGKSIMLGALGLLLGDRADFGSIRDTSKKCVIEGHFSIKDYALQQFFEKEDLDYEAASIIRREILPSGKSRAFINDTPVKITSLQKLGTFLIDIHSQHETLSLGNAEYQFNVIDTIAGNQVTILQYKEELRQYRKLQKRFEELQEEQAQASKEYDYNLFLLKELQEANLKAGMLEELEERYEALNNVEVLTENLGAAVSAIQQEEVGSLETLKSARAYIAKIAKFSGVYDHFHERLQSAIIELDDLEAEMTNALDAVEANPEELEQVNQALQVIYNLQKKHTAENVEELLQITEALQAKVEVTQNAEASLEAAEKAIQKQYSIIAGTAKKLHDAREKIIPAFIEQTELILQDLGMPNARLQIALSTTTEFLGNGNDKLEWLLAANKGGSFKEIKKAASGGELSRIMLAVKSILAAQSKLPTIIFDEIDTGVSGDIAHKMGEILARMGANMQVLAITHLPQIAGKGSSHFKIFKEDNEVATQTKIIKLEQEQRIDELAMMLGGSSGSDSARAHAKALLQE